MFLPIFAATLPELIRTRPLGWVTAPLFALSYVAMANVVLRWDWFFVNPWRGLLASHLFFGAIVLFFLLFYLRKTAGGGQVWGERNLALTDIKEEGVGFLSMVVAGQGISTTYGTPKNDFFHTKSPSEKFRRDYRAFVTSAEWRQAGQTRWPCGYGSRNPWPTADSD